MCVCLGFHLLEEKSDWETEGLGMQVSMDNMRVALLWVSVVLKPISKWDKEWLAWGGEQLSGLKG